VHLERHVPGEIHDALRDAVDRRVPAASLTLLGGGGGLRRIVAVEGRDPVGSLGDAALDREASREAATRLRDVRGARIEIESGGRRYDAFVDVWPPAPRLVVIGASHVAIPLVRIARTLGFRTIVLDPRSAFATRERFPDADELLVDWPEAALARIGLDAGTYVAVLSHDDKIDLPALKAALAAPVRYVGILGSRRTHARRERALLDAGVDAADLARIHAPIGLDLGGRRPDEIALAAMAEMIAATYPSGSGGAKVRM
jgi:xanthine dehydrogenase accessory factor